MSHHASCGLTPKEAYEKLKEGNQRFVAGKLQHPHQDSARREELASGQTPFAAVLTCSDSRVNLTALFDVGIGDIFGVENAGNYANPYDMGSLQYAIAHLSVPIVMVLGHTKCGAISAVKGLVETNGNVEKGLEPIVESLTPVVKEVKGREGDWIDNAARQNVINNVEEIRKLVKELGKECDCKVVGSYYDIKTGVVEEIVGPCREKHADQGMAHAHAHGHEHGCCCARKAQKYR